MSEQPSARAPRVIVAMDFDDPAAARSLAASLEPGACRLKVGKELFLRGGPALVAEWVAAGWQVFLDLKFHDIPNTVRSACRAAADLGVWMVDVHALGGEAMVAAAREGLEHAGGERPLLAAVTVLTSHDDAALERIGLAGPAAAAVRRLASLAADAGADGAVCAASEAAMLRRDRGGAFRLVTPGIRPAGDSHDDQRRVTTPLEAVAAGADDLVIGRPITRASDPAAALREVNRVLLQGGT